MDLTVFKDIKISEIIAITEMFHLGVKDATPLMRKLCEKNNITWEQGRKLCFIAKILEEA